MPNVKQKIKIIADSPCDLSPDLYQKYNIDTIPLLVTSSAKTYQDGIDINPDELYDMVEQTSQLPKTAAPSLETYAQKYQYWTDKGYSIINFCISSGFSASYNTAMAAASHFKDVYPIDSLNLSTGIGLLVLHAAELAQNGVEIQKIVDEINAARDRVRASFVIDTLQYLWKGGRCSGVTALGANLLRLKPCIMVKNGNMVVGKKYRGQLKSAILHYVEDTLKDRKDLALNRIFITHSGMDDPSIISDVQALIKKLQPFQEILITRAGCTISSHCGPNTLGILFMTK